MTATAGHRPASAIPAPADLTDYDQWVCWRRENDTKVPYQPNGNRASSTDPATWSTYECVSEAYQRGGFSGIGVVLTAPFVGIDIDNGIDEHGNLKTVARRICELFHDTYSEISPSGRGLKIFTKGHIPRAFKFFIGDVGIEIYSTGRYFTVTGRPMPGAPPHVEHSQRAIDAVLAMAPAKKQPASATSTSTKVAKGSRNNYLTSKAGAFRRIGTAPPVLEAALLEENKLSCDPPLSIDEVRAIARSVSQYAPKPKNGKALPDVVGAEDLLAAEFPDIEPLIAHILFPGVSLLIGRPKVGKSWFALQLALSIVLGRTFAGHFNVRRPGRVLYFALEESQRRTAPRIRKFIPDNAPDALRDLRFVYAIDSLLDGGAAQIDSLLTAHPSELVVLDTFLKATRAGGRSRDAVRADYNEIAILSEIAEKHNAAMLAVHHSKKESAHLEAVDAVISTTGVSAAADAVLHLKRAKSGSGRILTTTGREIEEEDYEFRFDIDNGGFAFTAAGEDVNVSEERKQILELLQFERKEMAPAAIARALSKNPVTVRRLLQRLYNDDMVRKSLSNRYFVA